jgi:hypothetical protein
MDQEASIFTAVPRTKTAEITNDSAVLLDSAGHTLFVLDRNT